MNYELKLLNQKEIKKSDVIDTLELARLKFPGSQNSLDALCKRYNIDNSKREKHNALIDCHLLKEVYINLLDQKAPKLNLENRETIAYKNNDNFKGNKKRIGKVIKPTEDEMAFHKRYLKSDLPKNYYN